jgi:hypothetical protein
MKNLINNTIIYLSKRLNKRVFYSKQLDKLMIWRSSGFISELFPYLFENYKKYLNPKWYKNKFNKNI